MESIHAFDVDDGEVSIGPNNRPYLVVQDEDVEITKRFIL